MNHDDTAVCGDCSCNQGRDCPHREARPLPGAGVVAVIGIMACAVASGCVLAQLWRAFL